MSRANGLRRTKELYHATIRAMVDDFRTSSVIVSFTFSHEACEDFRGISVDTALDALDDPDGVAAELLGVTRKAVEFWKSFNGKCRGDTKTGRPCQRWVSKTMYTLEDYDPGDKRCWLCEIHIGQDVPPPLTEKARVRGEFSA